MNSSQVRFRLNFLSDVGHGWEQKESMDMEFLLGQKNGVVLIDIRGRGSMVETFLAG